MCQPSKNIAAIVSGSLGGFQFDPKHASRSGRTANADRSAHHLRELLGHDQSDARAFLAAALLAETIERQEQRLQLIGSQSNPCVLHRDANTLRIGQYAVDDHRSVGAVIFDCIGKQIKEHHRREMFAACITDCATSDGGRRRTIYGFRELVAALNRLGTRSQHTASHLVAASARSVVGLPPQAVMLSVSDHSVAGITCFDLLTGYRNRSFRFVQIVVRFAFPTVLNARRYVGLPQRDRHRRAD
jgi:hypothetical protein